MLGWVLMQVDCSMGGAVASPAPPVAPAADTPPVQAAAPKVNWGCSANYRRLPIVGAVNTKLKPTIPEKYAVSFAPLDAMTMSWNVMTDAQPLTPQDVTGLPSITDHFYSTSSEIQTLVGSLSAQPGYTFVEPKIDVPLSSAGKPIPPSDDFNLRTSPLVLIGPFRSIVNASVSPIPAAWTKISVSYIPNDSDPAIRTSIIMATLTGVLYANR